jgi:flagellar basal-body rod protein FlgB
MNIFDRTMSLLQQTLDLRAARHQVIASNIANEETPGYRAKELQFLDALSSAIRGEQGGRLLVTNPRHLGPRGSAVEGVRGTITEIPAADLPLDANTVSLELEMAKLADNGINYNGAATIMSIRLRQLLDAVRDAR